MGSDREARVLAAADVIEVEGKQYKLRPLVVQHLCDLEREALAHYKRQYLHTFQENADLLGNGKFSELLEKKMDQVARWDLQDLPQRRVYDVRSVPINNEVKRWLTENFERLPDTEDGIRSLLVASLDSERLKPDDLKRMTGKAPYQSNVRYDQWWITGSVNGMVSFITSSVRREHPEVTIGVVSNWPFAKVAEAAQKINRITTAALGNT